MNYLTQIRTLREESRLSGDKLAYNLATTLLGEFERESKNINNEDALRIIKKMIKDNTSMIEALDGGFLDSSKEKEENKTLSSFLPAPMTEAMYTDIMMESDNLGKYMDCVQREASKHNMTADMKKAKQVWDDWR